MTFILTVAQVDQVLFRGDAKQITCPGVMGDLTILPHHAPLVTSLRAGELRIVDREGEVTSLPITSAVLEIADNEVTVLL